MKLFDITVRRADGSEKTLSGVAKMNIVPGSPGIMMLFSALDTEVATIVLGAGVELHYQLAPQSVTKSDVTLH